MLTKPLTANITTEAPNARQRQAGIQSLEIGMSVLEALAQNSSPMTLKDLSNASKLAPSKLHRYLVSWVRTGMLTQSLVDGRYDFGEASRRLGLAALSRLNEFSITNDYLLKLRDDTGLTAMLCVWGADGPRVVRYEVGVQPLMISVRIGATVPLGKAAAPILFLAHLPRAMTHPVIVQQRRQFGSAVLGPEVTAAELSEVRAKKSVVTHSELIRGIDAIAAPVFNSQGQLSSVLTLLGTHDQIRGTAGPKAEAAIEAAAAAITRALGGINPDAVLPSGGSASRDTVSL